MPDIISKQNQLLPFGFALIILLMVVATSLGVAQVIQNNRLMEKVVTQNNVKVSLATKMYIAARERSVLLLQMMAHKDPFERDKLFLKFNEMATRFIVARKELEKMNLDKKEIALLDKQMELIRIVAPTQVEIADLIAADEIEPARILLFQQAIPGQDKVLSMLRDILDYEQQSAERAFDGAARKVDETIHFIITLSIIFLFNRSTRYLGDKGKR
jgi:hypothetical protein